MIGLRQVRNNLSLLVWGLIVWRLKPPHSITSPRYRTLRRVFLIQTNHFRIDLEHLFGIVYHERGRVFLTNNEIELINMIRENDNPEQALLTATKVILDYLKQHGSSEEQAAVGL